MSSRTVPLLKTAVYQEVKYIDIGTAMSSRVVIAGNVTTLAARLRMSRRDPACRPRAAPRSAA